MMSSYSGVRELGDSVAPEAGWLKNFRLQGFLPSFRSSVDKDQRKRVLMEAKNETY